LVVVNDPDGFHAGLKWLASRTGYVATAGVTVVVSVF
jgi:hypothetical protein